MVSATVGSACEGGNAEWFPRLAGEVRTHLAPTEAWVDNFDPGTPKRRLTSSPPGAGQQAVPFSDLPRLVNMDGDAVTGSAREARTGPTHDCR